VHLRAFAVAALTLMGAPVRAAPPAYVLRMASTAPDGTAWAREIRAFARELEEATHGQVRLKLYLGGIAGNELQVGQRIARDQLDGAFSGGMLCMKIAPVMRVMRIPGLFQSRAELSYVIGHLKPIIDDEFRRAHFVNLGAFGIGPDLLYMRKPVSTLAELRKTRVWTWDIDAVLPQALRAMGLTVVTTSVEEAGHFYDDGKVDGFISVPAAALAFQWSTQARYLLPLRVSVLDGCVILTERAFDALPAEAQEKMRDVAGRSHAHLEEVGAQQDEQLLGGLFARQGLQTLPLPPSFAAEFYAEARAAREHLGDELAPRSLVQRVLTLLADFRAEHRPPSESF
jgi:TRAP-type C4-dicarboxylate transport system substrate-binding protein